jgi:hypothetical protein
MPNTSTIFGALFVAFLVFVTMRGELKRYLSLVGLG